MVAEADAAPSAPQRGSPDPTGLPLPGSSTRTVTWVFPTFSWSAEADAVGPLVDRRALIGLGRGGGGVRA